MKMRKVVTAPGLTVHADDDSIETANLGHEGKFEPSQPPFKAAPLAK